MARHTKLNGEPYFGLAVMRFDSENFFSVPSGSIRPFSKSSSTISSLPTSDDSAWLDLPEPKSRRLWLTELLAPSSSWSTLVTKLLPFEPVP
ncbi:hypothetical protein D3C72_685740 [compost metagenome]